MDMALAARADTLRPSAFRGTAGLVTGGVLGWATAAGLAGAAFLAGTAGLAGAAF